MTKVTITLPLPQNFAPSLPELQPRTPNWMGRIVHGFRNSESKGVIHWAFIHTIILIVSTILVVSVVLSPLFIYGFKEYIRQEERDRYDKKFQNLLNIAAENSRAQYLRGRLDPLSHLSISLPSSTRDRIIKDLEIPAEKVKEKTGKDFDKDLVISASLKYDNFIERYHIDVRFRSQWAIWRFFGW